MDTVYVETTVVGNVAGRFHADPNIAARRSVTRKWWVTAKQRYRLLASEFVIAEISAGDPEAASERFVEVEGLELLDATADVDELANSLVAYGAVPESQPRDALHIAVAAVNGVQYLVTWNFNHIANPILQNTIAAVCRDNGFEPPVICTPEQLLEAQDDSESD